MHKSSIDISPEFTELYSKYVGLGLEYLKTKKIVVVGLARDVGQTILNSFDQILKLNNFCDTLNIAIVENDSLDQTKDILLDLKNKHSNFEFVSEDYGLPKFGTVKDKARTEALAYQRNKYIELVKNKYQKYDYVIVCDWDFDQFSVNGLINSFGWIYEKNISAMCGVSLRYQNVLSQSYKNYWNYDCWAYRGNWWIDKQTEVNDCNSMLWFGFWIPPVGSPPLKINSGFGGMCIYKIQDFLSAKYSGYDCEHVCYHKSIYSINDQFGLYMNPSQLMILL